MSITNVGNVSIAGTLTQSSDERLKTNIERIPSSLERITALEGVQYNWLDKDKEQTKQIGLIAQATEKVFPEVVRTDDKGWKSVAYQNLVAPIINAIKELNQKLGFVDSRIEKLEKENSDMRAYLCAKDPGAPFCAAAAGR